MKTGDATSKIGSEIRRAGDEVLRTSSGSSKPHMAEEELEENIREKEINAKFNMLLDKIKEYK